MEQQQKQLLKRGVLTDKEGFYSGVEAQKSMKLQIDGVNHNYFFNNNPTKREIVKELQIGDKIEYEVRTSNGFKFIDNLRKIEFEVKEFKEPTEPTVETMKIQPRNEIKYGLAFKLTHYKWIFMKRQDPLTDETTFLQDVDNTYNLMGK